jgi:hypothetical protein
MKFPLGFQNFDFISIQQKQVRKRLKNNPAIHLVNFPDIIEIPVFWRDKFSQTFIYRLIVTGFFHHSKITN